VGYAGMDARGLANGHPEQTSEEQQNPSMLDASIDPALQSYAASSLAFPHRFDGQSMSGHLQTLDASVISGVPSHIPDSVTGVQETAHYPNGALPPHPGNPQVKPPQSAWPELPIRPPWVCPYPLCDRQGKPFAQKSALERHIKSQHLGIRDHICDLCGSAFSRADVLKAKHRPICKGVPPQSPGSNQKSKKRKPSAVALAPGAEIAEGA